MPRKEIRNKERQIKRKIKKLKTNTYTGVHRYRHKKTGKIKNKYHEFVYLSEHQCQSSLQFYLIANYSHIHLYHLLRTEVRDLDRTYALNAKQRDYPFHLIKKKNVK